MTTQLTRPFLVRLYVCPIALALFFAASSALLPGHPVVLAQSVPEICPCTTFFPESVTPAVPDSGDSRAVELGIRFRSDTDGQITGLRFYKSLNNTGTHLGNLWSSTGTLLATATFTDETSSGWQEVSFSPPATIAADTDYVASYHTNVGNYSANLGYFETGGIDRAPLHAAGGLEGINGVYRYGQSDFPHDTYRATNYWVDIVFAPAASDAAPPEILGLGANAIDGNSMTLSWTTNEVASSRVEHSVDSAMLPANTTSILINKFVLSHAIPLTQLQASTTYYYRVTSVDRAGNSTTTPMLSFTTPGPTLRDNLTVNFAGGTHDGEAYVSETENGEVTLRPIIGAEFTGTTLPPGWLDVTSAAFGSIQVKDGNLVVDGALVGACNVQPSGACVVGANDEPFRSIEFVATFSGDVYQHAGLGVTLIGGQPWALFGTFVGGDLWARTSNGTTNQDTQLGVSFLGAPHRFRIDWHADRVDYYIDGVSVVSHPIAITELMRAVAASDVNSGGGNLVVDWVRMSPYPSATSVFSRVFDAGAPVDWRSIQWLAETPSGTSLSIAVRTGDTPTPDGTWSGFQAAATPGTLTSRTRYIQYRLSLSTTDATLTPALKDIVITTNAAPVATNDFGSVPGDGSITFPATGPGSLTFNDVDADTPSIELRVIAVGHPAQGTAVLNGDGSVSYTPAEGATGVDAFQYTVSDGLLTSTATVTIVIGAYNPPPVSLGEEYVFDEDTTLMVTAATGVLANDQDPNGDALTALLSVSPTHGTLLGLNADGSFIYTPLPNYAGPDSFVYRASDGQSDGNLATVALVIRQVNDPPMAAADAYSVVKNTLAAPHTLSVPARGVLDNDLDTEVEDTAMLTAALVANSGPTHGTLSFNADGSFAYTPDLDFVGSDGFSYRATDQFDQSSAVASVTITVLASAIVQTVTPAQTATGPVTVSNQTDPAGATPATPIVTAVTTSAPGTVSIGTGAIETPASSGYTFLGQEVFISAPAASPESPLTMTFMIDGSLIPPGHDHTTVAIFRNGALVADCDPEAPAGTASPDPCVASRVAAAPPSRDVTMTVRTSHASEWNTALPTPLANVDAFTTTRDTTLTVDSPGVLINDVADGESPQTAALVDPPASGVLSLAPDGSFSYTPAANSCAPVTFTYQTSSGGKVSNIVPVSIGILCVQNAPVFSKGPDQTTAEDSGPQTVPGWATDISYQGSGSLSFRIDGNNNPGLFTAGPAIAPDGQLSYTPAPHANGVANIAVTLTDQSADSATAMFTITVTPVNDPPTFTPGADLNVFGNPGPQTIPGWATAIAAGPADEAGQALAFTITSNSNPRLFLSAPAISPDGTLTFTPIAFPGSATIVVVLRDNGGTTGGGKDTSVSRSFTIRVQRAETGTTVMASVHPSISKHPVTFTATVATTQTGTGEPTGLVLFTNTEGSGTSIKLLGAAMLVQGRASLTISHLSVGNHKVTAIYLGNLTFVGSQSPLLGHTVLKK